MRNLVSTSSPLHEPDMYIRPAITVIEIQTESMLAVLKPSDMDGSGEIVDEDGIPLY